MIVAPRDDNRIPTLLGVDSSLFKTPTTVAVDPVTHAMLVEATFTGDQSVEITDGTNIANILKSDGTAAGQNAVITASGYKAASGTAGVLNADAFNFDAGNYDTISLYITGSWSGQLSMQGSNDNSNWNQMQLLNVGDATNFASGYGSNDGWYGSIYYRYIRLRMTSYSSGTAIVNYIVRSTGNAVPYVVNSIGSKSNTGSGVPSGAFYMGGKNDSGNLTGLLIGSQTTSNSLAVVLASDQVTIPVATAPSGTALNTFSLHSTSNATTTPTASTAYISSIAVSNEVGGTTSTITIQDKQGTPLKLVNGLATTALTTAPTIINFQTPVKMVSGIDIITAGAVAATVDIWINYYG